MSTDNETQVIEREEVDIEEPGMYNVILLNDDYTPFDFVVYLLVEVFNKDGDSAWAITSDVHKKGKGIAGTYIKDVAETKSLLANKTAKANGYPLETVTEEA